VTTKETETPTESARIVDRAEKLLVRFSEDEKARADAIAAAQQALPAKIVADLDKLLEKADSYRDALLVALAVPVVRGEQVDIRKRDPGGRSASDRIGRILRRLHIKGVVGAYQNIGKNSPLLVRGNNKVFDAVLTWGAKAELAELEAAHTYLAARIAATARRVETKPQLRIANLSFGRVMSLLSAMLDEPSGGAHEQYVLAALMEVAFADEGVRVTTKSMSASDHSSRTAGDIEVTSRGRLQEGIEVSANRWRDKLEQADDIIRDHGLARAHIVAEVSGRPYADLVAATAHDISVLAVEPTVAALVAFLDRRSREAALLRLYELLDERVASPDLVNRYVERLRAAELAEE
jgi:hypothetical protein